jgi:hypothetical protein
VRGLCERTEKIAYEELSTLYSSPRDEIKDDKMDGLYSTHGRYENAYKILIVRLEGKISL